MIQKIKYAYYTRIILDQSVKNAALWFFWQRVLKL